MAGKSLPARHAGRGGRRSEPAASLKAPGMTAGTGPVRAHRASAMVFTPLILMLLPVKVKTPLTVGAWARTLKGPKTPCGSHLSKRHRCQRAVGSQRDEIARPTARVT